ncbi:hypothetical protein ARMGADRAFT_479642 [Armillaria gallica]|uniref:Uncharacterized protein n=1 Tax=Armillaria gallica TaxID=47427 RepID=A0A2H3D7D2_ARMGA|nr:hypothetical protein ARMGADRAFT_479642 [Armillaria gallica]
MYRNEIAAHEIKYDRLAEATLNRLSDVTNSFFASNLNPPAPFHAIANTNFSLNMGLGLHEDDGCGSAQRDGLWSCRRMGFGPCLSSSTLHHEHVEPASRFSRRFSDRVGRAEI